MGLGVFSFSILAASAFASGADFCDAPYKAICENAEQTQAARDSRYGERRIDIVNNALRSHRLPAELFEDKIRGLEITVVLANIQRVKQLLGDAIKEQHQIGRLTFFECLQMLAKIETVEVWTSFRLNRHFSDDSILKQKQIEYNEFCGTDGMADNAFAGSENGKPYIFLCPGGLLRAAVSTDDRSHDFLNLLQTMAHEFGHHIDFGDFEKTYQDMNACYAKHYSRRLQYGDSPYDYVASHVEKTGNLRFVRAVQNYKVRTHSREITADFWAVQTVKQYLATVAQEDRLQSLKEAYEGLCTGIDVGKHPDGTYRIGLVLGSDHGIRRLMGCTDYQNKVSCALNGAELY